MSPDLLNKAKRRMGIEGLSQRELAVKLGVSQGHLSKVLRGQSCTRSTRLSRALAAYGNGQPTPEQDLRKAELALVEAARNASGPAVESMHFLIDLMHLIIALRAKAQTVPRGDSKR
jgi:transcriptional regulator with XRE-family HTH domain